MKIRNLFIFLTLFAISSASFSDVLGKAQTFASLKECKESRKGRIAVVDNGVGSDPYQVVCKDNTGSGGWEWVRVGGSGDVVSAGDEDGQTIQGLTGNNKARIELSLEGEVDKAALIGGGATPAFAFVDNAYFSAQSPDTNSSIQVTDGSVQISSDAAVGLSVVPTGAYFGASATSFYAGSPDSTNTIDVSNAAVRILYSQTPPTDADDPCTAGDTIDTATFHYYCAATDTWVRVAMATWP